MKFSASNVKITEISEGLKLCKAKYSIKLNNLPTTFVFIDPAPNLQPIGCYNDSAKERALPVFYANARGNIDWFNMDLTVNQCAQVASDMGYEYFGVQFYASATVPGMLRKVMPNMETLLRDAGSLIIKLDLQLEKRGQILCIGF